MLDRLQYVKQRFDEISDLIIQPDVIADQKRYVQLNKEYKDLKALVDKREEYINRRSIPFVHSICPADPLRPRARAPPPRCGRLQARRRTISPDAIDLHAPFAARLEALALRRRCARTPKSGQLVPALRPTDGAECARVLCRWCGGEGADAARRAAQPAPNVVPRPAA